MRTEHANWNSFFRLSSTGDSSACDSESSRPSARPATDDTHRLLSLVPLDQPLVVTVIRDDTSLELEIRAGDPG